MIKQFHFIILILGNLLCAHSYALAQPENETYVYLIQANNMFRDGDFKGALINYQKVIEEQPSNNYVLEQIKKAKEELLYIDIMDEINVEENCQNYISKYGENGKYTVNVKNMLSQSLLAKAYKYYQGKDTELLEGIYLRYLTLLGSVKSQEMKQWLYSLCNEAAIKSMKEKEWAKAKSFFERSLKYASTNDEFSDAQKGITRTLKKI